MILHLYFARRFATTFAIVAMVFLGIVVLIDIVEQIRRFEGDGLSFVSLLGLSLLSVPQAFYGLLPLLTIIATISLFLNLARTSELVVARAAGRSALRSLAGPVGMAVGTGVLAVALLNPIVAATGQRYDLAAERLTGGARSALSISDEGLWLRQGDATGQTVIHARTTGDEGTRLTGATFISFSAGGRPTARIEAAEARLTDGAWTLVDVKEWQFDKPNPEAGAIRRDRLSLPSNLTPEQILDSFADPSSVSIWRLPAFIERLERAGFSAQRHRVWLQSELALPLLLAGMVVIGAAFTVHHARLRRTGPMVLMALGMGFGLFFIRNFAQILAETGQIPAALAAWGPPVAAVLLPLGLLLHWEDG